ncbi:MAG: GAF domain-containing SpoIIE family protein phosphatase [Peptostreptococcaceae bacterium]
MEINQNKYDKMKNLVEISALITGSIDFFDIKDKIVEKMLKVIKPKKACINLFYENSFEYAYLVCSKTLDIIPSLYPLNDKIGRKIDFDDYPKYIHESVKEKKIIKIDDIRNDKRSIDEVDLSIKEGYSGRIVFPLIINDNVVGFMTCFLDKEDILKDEDIDFISSVSSLISLSIEITNRNRNNQILIDKLRNSISTINDATQKLYQNKNIHEFLDDLTKKVCYITKSEECAIIIEKEFDEKKTFSFYNKNNKNNQSYIYPVIDKIKSYDKHSLYKNKVNISEKVNSFIYNRLQDDDIIIGYIVCANGTNYTEDDLNVISIFSKQLHVAIKIFEYNEQQVNHKLLTNELELLSKQQQLLMTSKKFKEKDELDFYHKPARVVGGDFFYSRKIDNKIVYILVDVMGHGIVSNYVVAMIKGAFKVLSKLYKTSSEIATNLNSMLYDEFDKMSVFATCLVSIVDYDKNTVSISNAGHYSPIITDKNNQIKRNINCKKGIPLGIIESSEYENNIFNLDDISSVWMYTDGIIEIKNEKKEEFSVDRLENFVINNLENEFLDIKDNLEKELFDFSNKENYDDDILTVIFKNR